MTAPTDRPMARLVSRALSGALLIPALTAVGAQTPERHTLSGNDIAIYNIAGVMRVEGGSGSEVSVSVTRQGSDAAKLRIEQGPIRGRETLRVIYPESRVVYRESDRNWGGRTRLYVRDDGTFGGDSGDHGGDGRRVEIVSRGDGMDASADLTVTVPRGKRVALHLAAGEVSVTNVEGDILVDVHMANLTTRGTKGVLDLDTGSGRVQVTDADGEVNLDTGSGSVTLTKIRGSRLRLDTGSGRVRGSDITVTDLDVDTGSGDVELSAVRSQDIVLDSGSGSVELELADDVRSLRVDSGSGDVTIGIPTNLGAEITAETGSGGIEFDIPVEVRKRERDYISGKIGDGQGRIIIDTGSGEVRLRRS